MAGEWIFTEVTTPSTPSAGKEAFWITNDATPQVARKNSAGTVIYLLSGGSAAWPAGTTTVPSALMASGTVHTTPQAGALEYDGVVPYYSPVASSRGVLQVVYFTTNVADFTLANSASAQSPFEAARDVLTVNATTTYLMEGLITITGMGAVTRTTALEFDAGTASLTSIYYEGLISTGAANTIYTVAPTGITAVAATAQVLNATVATAAATISWKGIVRTNTGGTFIPQIKFSADPTGTLICKKDSYCKLTPLGINTVGSIGRWA